MQKNVFPSGKNLIMFFCEIQFRPNPYFIEPKLFFSNPQPKLFFSNQLCFWQFHAKDIVTDILVKLLAVLYKHFIELRSFYSTAK